MKKVLYKVLYFGTLGTLGVVLVFSAFMMVRSAYFPGDEKVSAKVVSEVPPTMQMFDDELGGVQITVSDWKFRSSNEIVAELNSQISSWQQAHPEKQILDVELVYDNVGNAATSELVGAMVCYEKR